MMSIPQESKISLKKKKKKKIHVSILPQISPWIIKQPKAIFLNELPKQKPIPALIRRNFTIFSDTLPICLHRWLQGQ